MPGTRQASGGSYVGSKPTGNYGMSLYHHIRFTDTGYTEFNSHEECERIRRDTEHEFEVLVLDAHGNIVTQNKA